jgi:hypothetical protein
MYTHELVSDAMGPQVSPSVISRHRSEAGAERALRARNPHLYDKRWAQRHGMSHSGTFDRIREIGTD